MNDHAIAAANMNGAEIIAAALKRHGVEWIFGQSIPTALFLAAPDHGIRQIGYRTENAGAMMADAYARISHRVGVVAAQNGPAATLLVPGLAEAKAASIPLIAIVQDVDRRARDRNAFQELDHFALFGGVTKWLRRIDACERIDDYVDMAFTAATSGRPGPVVLLVPYDLLSEPSPAPMCRQLSLGHYPLDRPIADPAAIDEAANLLAAARCPVIYAGGGVHASDASTELAALQQRFHLPVATTTMGKGAVDENHPLSIGVLGYFMGSRGMTCHQRPLVEQADVILLVGNRTNQNGTDSWKLLPPQARYIHIDIDGLEIGRNYEAHRLAGDAKSTLQALIDALARKDTRHREASRSALESRIVDAKASHRAETADIKASNNVPIRPERLMAELDRLLTPEHIVVSDASYASIWSSNYLSARRPGMRFLTPRGLAGLGWGLPMAIGAKIAQPQSPVFCLVGDGGFAHVWSELETARRHGLSLVVAVLNNQILGYQKDAEDILFGNHSEAVELGPVDHAMIARACGCRGHRIERPDEIAGRLKEAFAADEVTVLDVLIDPSARPPITSFEGHLE
ncbi:MAG: acetolactate synthase catalytic subunit [Dongiaceae bacterium]